MRGASSTGLGRREHIALTLSAQAQAAVTKPVLFEEEESLNNSLR